MDRATLQEMQHMARSYKASDSRGFWELFSNLMITASAIFLSLSPSWIAWGIGQVVLVISFWRWFGILHTAVHSACFKSPKMNTFIGHLASVFCFLPYESWKKSHLEHHRWTGWRQRDPSLSLPSPEEISPAFKKVLDICWKFHIPVFSVIFTLSKFFSDKKDTDEVSETSLKNKIVLPLAHLIFLVVLGSAYFKVFLIPFLSYLLMSDVVTLSQHNILDSGKLTGEPRAIPLWEHPHHTRTLKYPRWVSRHVFLYFDKHTLHHLLPHVPHYHIESLGEWGIKEEEWDVWLKKAKKLPGHQVYLK